MELGNGPPVGGDLHRRERDDHDRSRQARSPIRPRLAREVAKGAAEEATAHIENWMECIKSRRKPNADVEIGHRSATVCHLGNIARWTGRKLRWDPVKEIFPDDAEANKYLDRPRRKPYELPEQVPSNEPTLRALTRRRIVSSGGSECHYRGDSAIVS